MEFGLILAGLAAATLVAKWASDETSGRLEFLLASPLARVRWVVAGAIGILIGILVFVALSEVGIAIGTIVADGDLALPLAGTLVLGFYAIGLAGIGIGVGGLFGARFAATVVALVTIITWGLDIIAPPLGLADVRRSRCRRTWASRCWGCGIRSGSSPAWRCSSAARRSVRGASRGATCAAEARLDPRVSGHRSHRYATSQRCER